VNLPTLGGLGAGREDRDAEALLESRRLVQEFIVRNDLMPQLYPDARSRPSLWRAVTNFQKYALAIRQDPRRGVTSLTVEWTDPAVAARWANGLVALANELIRTHALQEAQRNITYLTGQSEHTSDVDLRRGIFSLIENETKTLMLANGRTEYAFRIIDPAVAPEIRAAPHRTLILITGFAVGLAAGVLLILGANWVARQRARLRGEP
jgi:LPS O-antigen subunit length determinant protein (WzzB/FepE family)